MNAVTPPRASRPVETTGGTVRGRHARRVVEFLGIPYGEPAGSAHRFPPPRPRAPRPGVLDAHAHGPAAPQLTRCPQPWSEDCLVLNVWTPALDAPRRPVAVYTNRRQAGRSRPVLAVLTTRRAARSLPPRAGRQRGRSTVATTQPGTPRTTTPSCWRGTRRAPPRWWSRSPLSSALGADSRRDTECEESRSELREDAEARHTLESLAAGGGPETPPHLVRAPSPRMGAGL
ncbi:carboxylesterase family protein [Streptomyces sp. NPDC007088]|uniref:carboxylesterase family protein n=1 Tax=Streptomyces sp. NPDC007088 TaxID=3364773 RepID=UPI00368E3E86